MPINTERMVSVINSNKDKRVSAKKIIESNPPDLPVVSKLIADKETGREVDKDDLKINRGALENIHRRISSVKTNNRYIIELFPDIELAIQILVSSILSPKKMTDAHVNFRLNKDLNFGAELNASLLEEAKTYIEKVYGFEEMLPDITREALFTSGASAYAIIPEAAVDEIINADLLASYSVENFKTRVDVLNDIVAKPRSILSLHDRKVELDQDKPTTESFLNYLASESLVNLTDNTLLLHYPNIKEKITSKLIRSAIRGNSGIATESMDKINYLDLFRDRSNVGTGNKEVQFVASRDETKRKSLGRPMLIKFPTESVMPAFSPGNEKDHVGCFVLLDESGKPLSSAMDGSDVSKLDTGLHNAGIAATTPIQKAYRNLVNNQNGSGDMEELYEMYKTVLERQLFSTVKSSLYGRSVEVANKSDIYFMMFCRALQGQRTSVLFIPKEQMVYFAFQYNENGTGRTLLENLATQTSLRAILMFAKVMAYAKQSIDVTKVNVQLDENDPDPEASIEKIQASVLKMRQNFLPLGINNPVDLVNWIQRAGLQFAYEGNALLPNVKIDFENSNLTHTVPDSDLEEELRKQSIIALGLPPETIDNGFSPEFARTVINNNVLLSKRVALYQKKLEADGAKFISLLVYSDYELRDILGKILLSNLGMVEKNLEEDQKALLGSDKEAFISDCIDKIAENLYLEFPKPEDTDLSNLTLEFDLYKESLEKVLDSVISTDIFPENISGEMADHIDTLKNIHKHALLRKWMADNNFIPEVFDISSTNVEEADAVLENLGSHLVSTMRNNAKLLSMMKEYRLAVDKDLNKIYNGEDLSGSDDSSGGTDTPSDNTDNAPSEGLDDDFDLDAELKL